MENITIGEIAKALTTITVIMSFVVMIYKFVKLRYIDRFNKIEQRMDKLAEHNNQQDEEVKKSKEEREILLRGELACLKGLKEQGCNGPVTKAINDIEEYLVENFHK